MTKYHAPMYMIKLQITWNLGPIDWSCPHPLLSRILTIPVRATPSKIPKRASCGLYKNSGSGEMRLMGWSWSDTIRNGKGVVGWDRRVSPNMVEYPKRTQLGCPFSSYEVYILCYIYFRMFDRAMGTHAYRRIHNTIIACVRIIIPTVSLRAFGVAFGLSWAEIIKKNKEFNFNVFLTIPYTILYHVNPSSREHISIHKLRHEWMMIAPSR